MRVVVSANKKMENNTHVLVVSRNRNEAMDDSNTASLLAEKYNVRVLDIPFLYDFPAEHSVIERLRYLGGPAYFLVPISHRSAKSLLERLQIPFAEVFETQDAVLIPDGGINGGTLERFDELFRPRWYPIIDNSKCTACLECVNYCLFGVYSISEDSCPFVDQPDACRDGCPACARVCPNQAIMFPLYEDRVIAGYEQVATDNLNDLIDVVDQI